MACPARLALCGVPCGCDGRNPSHRGIGEAVMRCTCDASESPHHHQLGAVYPCEGYTSCRRCRDYDERVWSTPGERRRPAQHRQRPPRSVANPFHH